MNYWNPDPNEPPTPGPGALGMHDLVYADALSCNYRTLASIIADRGRLWRIEHGQRLVILSGDDPMVAAIQHLADAAVRLQQAKQERAPRAAQHYEAVLLIAGHMAREIPFAAAAYRRPPGRAA